MRQLLLDFRHKSDTSHSKCAKRAEHSLLSGHDSAHACRDGAGEEEQLQNAPCTMHSTLGTQAVTHHSRSSSLSTLARSCSRLARVRKWPRGSLSRTLSLHATSARACKRAAEDGRMRKRIHFVCVAGRSAVLRIVGVHASAHFAPWKTCWRSAAAPHGTPVSRGGTNGTRRHKPRQHACAKARKRGARTRDAHTSAGASRAHARRASCARAP